MPARSAASFRHSVRPRAHESHFAPARRRLSSRESLITWRACTPTQVRLRSRSEQPASWRAPRTHAPATADARNLRPLGTRLSFVAALPDAVALCPHAKNSRLSRPSVHCACGHRMICDSHHCVPSSAAVSAVQRCSAATPRAWLAPRSAALLLRSARLPPRRPRCVPALRARLLRCHARTALRMASGHGCRHVPRPRCAPCVHRHSRARPQGRCEWRTPQLLGRHRQLLHQRRRQS